MSVIQGRTERQSAGSDYNKQKQIENARCLRARKEFSDVTSVHLVEFME